MNFLDTYDINAGATTPPQSSQPEQSLNEEVSQVIGQLGRFWGGFRKQSQAALETARKDLGDVVSQAQKELSKLTAETSDNTGDALELDPEPSPPSSEDSSTLSSSTTTVQETPTPSGSNQSLFSRLQATLPPNIVSTVQRNIPDTLKHASDSIDFSQLRTTLSTEFQRVQGVTRAQAEEYVHKSEGLLREAMKEAGEVLKEAVKVVPPEEAGSSAIWDGKDAWTPSSTPATPDAEYSWKGKGKESGSGPSSGRPSGDAQRAVTTRAESMLKQLKHDPEIVKADPRAEETSRDAFESWIDARINVTEDGLEDDEWMAKISQLLQEPVDGLALQDTLDTLVPSHISREDFWKRYFFRAHQIEQEEEKRKALIEGRIDNEEDFTWDDEDEATSPTTATKLIETKTKASTPSAETLKPARHTQSEIEVPSTPSSQIPTPATTSPRGSSEESYDLLSSGNASTNGEKRLSETKEEDDDADSDWE